MADTFYSRKPEADASALELKERVALLALNSEISDLSEMSAQRSCLFKDFGLAPKSTFWEKALSRQFPL